MRRISGIECTGRDHSPHLSSGTGYRLISETLDDCSEDAVSHEESPTYRDRHRLAVEDDPRVASSFCMDVQMRLACVSGVANVA